ncbi:hypothetical protein AURDEDRAFT_65417 [Auricularia subglabra TFB-10046 SS5]|nr:hypothetical protein AURDEDRAFT_65417 [Auricularia subglabra TFB-10046 SS5]
MHELSNLALHLIKLWRGKLDCIEPDDRNAWRWMVLTGELWKRHGQCVADSKPFLPGSFDRPPRNPAEKINSGYKAWELIQYIYELGPGLLLGILPKDFWENYCKLVAAIRLLSQRRITLKDLERSYVLVVEFIEEFERLYYQRIPERLHFLPQIIHNLQHMPHEVCRLGLGGYYSQWTMERTIGNLTEEIKQHSDPYRNLSMRALRRAQVNALKAIYPAIEETVDREKLAATAIPLPESYALLRKRDRKAYVVKGAQAAAIQEFKEHEGAQRPSNPKAPLKIQRYARLALPNGQVACSRWAEKGFRRSDVRQACNVKLESGGEVFFAEVAYYFQTKVNGVVRTMAMLSLFGQPDIALLRRSAFTLWSCERPTGEMMVLDYHLIKSVIAMVPFSEAIQGADFAGRVFVVEKIGLDVAPMANALDFEELTKDGEEVDEEEEEEQV